MMTDKRRYVVIEVRRRNAETYHLMIDGQMWSESSGRTIGKPGAFRTPPATASHTLNISWERTGTCRQLSDSPNA
jgi:hypothetical protein